MKTIEKKQLENIRGAVTFGTTQKVIFCPICGYTLRDEDITGEAGGWYSYVCPDCGSKRHLKK